MLKFFLGKSEPNLSHQDIFGPSADIMQVNEPRTSSEITTPETKLESKIFSLYRQVWLGIFQVNDKHGPSHMKRLAELFTSAGMSSYINRRGDNPEDHYNSGRRRCKPMDTPLLRPLHAALMSGSGGLGSLRLFDGPSVASLEAVIELLKAYVKEIESMKALYHLPRGLQVGLRMPTEDDEKAVLEQFIPAANQFARQVLHLEARVDLLVSNLEDEFWKKHGPIKGRNGWSVHDVLFKPTNTAKVEKKVSLLRNF
ncbi:hypothetical protein N7523_002996 [Penicillium sp. IBT 18751x]|nr:hypothetical protein N7523_002996 [Penicillium sp. IBT 18751x]